MSDYPAGAEHDSKAPYNESLVDLKCDECYTDIQHGDFCHACFEYTQQENKKSIIIDDLNQLIDLHKSLENMYYVGRLSKIVKQIKEL